MTAAETEKLMTAGTAGAIPSCTCVCRGQSSQGGYYSRAASISLRTWFVEATI